MQIFVVHVQNDCTNRVCNEKCWKVIVSEKMVRMLQEALPTRMYHKTVSQEK